MASTDRSPGRFTTMSSPVGTLVVTGDGQRLTGCYFGDGKHDLSAVLDGRVRDDDGFVDARTQLGEYFAGRRQSFDLDVDPQGTEFQLAVWAQLQTIEFGETRSYGAVAQAVGNPKGSRAVGMANGRNPISIVIPCHRVIGANGTLTGYAGGTDVKRYLLDLESARLPLA